MHLSRFLPVLALLAAPALSQCLIINNSPPGTDLQLGDDNVRVVSLPFSFPFNGVSYDRITIDSNGTVRLGDSTGTNPSDWSPTAAELLNDPHPTLALLWDDWNSASCAPGNGIFYEADATRASVAWKGVPQFGTGTGWLDGEVVLQPDGSIHYYYSPACTLQASGDAIVAVSRGSGAPANLFSPNISVSISDATSYHIFNASAKGFELAGWSYGILPTGPSDYAIGKALLPDCAVPLKILPEVSAGPTVIGVGCPAVSPMVHTSNTIAMGTNFTMEATLPDPASFFGLFVIGLSNPSVPLDIYGMIGCTQYATDELSYFPTFFTPGTNMVRQIPVPYEPSISMELFTQAAAWSTLTPFGVITSNGLRHVAGL